MFWQAILYRPILLIAAGFDIQVGLIGLRTLSITENTVVVISLVDGSFPWLVIDGLAVRVLIIRIALLGGFVGYQLPPES